MGIGMDVNACTPEFKRQIAEQLVDGHDWRRVAHDYQLPVEALLDWLCEYVRQFPQLFEQSTHAGGIENDEQHAAYIEWQDALYASVAKVEAVRAKQSVAGKNRSREVVQEGEVPHEALLFDELDGRLELLGKPGLADILYERRHELPEESRRELEWVDDFVKRLVAYKKLIDAETTNAPDADDLQIAMRVQKNEHKIRKRLRRDVPWIVDTIKKLRPLK
jgi:hypothetical protein